MDNKTKKAVEMLKKLAKSVDGTSTEERIIDAIGVLTDCSMVCDECGNRRASVRHVENETRNCNVCEFCSR